MLLNSCRRESVGETVGRTAAAVSSLLPDGDVITFSPGYCCITGSKEKGPAQHLALGTVSRPGDPAI